MKKIALMILAVGALLFVSCGGASNGPESVAKKAITAIQKGDYDAYAATFDLSESDQKMLSGMAQEKVGKTLEAKGGIKSFSIADTKIDEEKATVKVHFVYKDGSEDDQNMSFKLVDGDWKQDLKK